MTHATAYAKASRIAKLLGGTLAEVLDDRNECAMLTLLLFATGCETGDIKHICNHNGLPSTIYSVADRLDMGLNLWRGELNRQLQYRHILDTLANEDTERAKREGRALGNGIARFGETGGKPVAVAAGKHKAPTLRGGRKAAPRNPATHEPTAAAH